MNRRHFITAGGTVLAAGVSGCATTQATADIGSYDENPLIRGAEPTMCAFPYGVCALDVAYRQNGTLGRHELWIISEHVRDVYHIQPKVDDIHVEPITRDSWTYPITIEARGYEESLIDRVTLREGN